MSFEERIKNHYQKVVNEFCLEFDLENSSSVFKEFDNSLESKSESSGNTKNDMAAKIPLDSMFNMGVQSTS